MTSKSVIPAERIERRILAMRGQKVLLDADLAELYGVATKALNQAVRRNIDRFPRDFMFRLTQKESDGLLAYWESAALRSQIVTSKEGRGGRRYLPLAFTEQGVAMLSSVLHSPRAVKVNIAIMRAFVKLREILATHQDLAQRLEELESKYDEQFRVVFDAIRELMAPPQKPRRRIGFGAPGVDESHPRGVRLAQIPPPSRTIEMRQSPRAERLRRKTGVTYPPVSPDRQ